jgi:hypothetical protein
MAQPKLSLGWQVLSYDTQAPLQGRSLFPCETLCPLWLRIFYTTGVTEVHGIGQFVASASFHQPFAG